MRAVLLPATLLLAALAPSPATAQSCGSGTTATHYLGGLGGHGAFVDITVGAADMTIECVDVSAISSTGVVDVELYWCAGSSFGNETNAAAWTLFASAAGVPAAGAGVATSVDVSGNGMVFAAGQSYGLLIVNSNGQVFEYTPGAPTTFSGTHCDLTTNGGSFYPFSFYWADRVWNGALHTEPAAPSGPTLGLAGGCPGPVQLTAANCTPGGGVAFAYSLTQGAWTVPGGPACVGTVLPLVQPVLLGTVPADAAGTAPFGGNAPPAACGRVAAVAVDLTSCTPTNVVAL